MALLWIFASPLLSLLGQDPAVVNLTSTFLRLLLPSLLPTLAFECLKRFLQAQGIAIAYSFVILASTLLNFPLTYFLIWSQHGIGIQGVDLLTIYLLILGLPLQRVFDLDVQQNAPHIVAMLVHHPTCHFDTVAVLDPRARFDPFEAALCKGSTLQEHPAGDFFTAGMWVDGAGRAFARMLAFQINVPETLGGSIPDLEDQAGNVVVDTMNTIALPKIEALRLGFLFRLAQTMVGTSSFLH